jgi:hypothetical protein
MHENIQVKALRTEWLRRGVKDLAHGVSVHADLLILLNRFYDTLMQAIETNNPNSIISR